VANRNTHFVATIRPWNCEVYEEVLSALLGAWHLIVRGHTKTMIYAFRLDEEMDASVVVWCEPLSLHDAAAEIFDRAAAIIGDMISHIVEPEVQPELQQGDPVIFNRRKPEKSEFTDEIASLDQPYDHIRMLDAEEYPKAFLRLGSLALRFSKVQREDGRAEASAVATRPGSGSNIALVCAEVPSSTGYLRPTEWEPNLYIEIAEADLEAKIRAMKSYAGEMRPDPYPRSPEVLRALAKVRGSEAGVMLAEAYMIHRAFG